MTTTGQRSTTAHNFATIEGPARMRSVFDRGHSIKTTFDSGFLVPILVDEVYPGDQINMNMTMFGRLATPIFPFMDNVFLDSFFFFCPKRLLWNNWQKFMGEQDNPGDSTDFLTPQIVSPDAGDGEADANGGWAELSLADYFGVPTKVKSLSCNAFAWRMYNRVYNEHFRSQDLQNSVDVELGDGPDASAKYKLLRRTKRHDYFTSCLPFPQKGPAVTLPFSGTAPITGLGMDTQSYTIPSGTFFFTDGSAGEAKSTPYAQAQLGLHVEQDPNNVGFPNIRADFENAAITSTINDLREAFAVQRILERDARGGTRYTEIVQSHFGVVSPDARLQRSEYLGGSSVPVNVNPVAQTSSTDSTTPQGNLAAIGTVLSRRNGFVKGFTEHGYLMCLVNVRADLNYQQGLPRFMSRRTRYDFYWPSLAHLGEQAVLNKEIYAQGSTVVDGNNEPVDDGVFGYNERFAEMRFRPSLITGRYRSNAAQTLDPWHIAQNFTALPVLNNEFIEENPPLHRVLAVNSEPQLKLDVDVKARWTRQVPMYGTPGFIDHF